MSVSGPVGMIVILEEVDDGGIAVQFAKEQGAAKAAVADDQIGLYVGAGLEGLIDAIAIPDLVFERARAEMVGGPGSAGGSVNQPMDARDVAAGGSGGEGDLPPMPFNQAAGDVAELGGEIRMNIQNVHDPNIVANGGNETSDAGIIPENLTSMNRMDRMKATKKCGIKRGHESHE